MKSRVWFALSLVVGLATIPACNVEKILIEKFFAPVKPKKVRAIEFWHSMTGDKSQVLNTIVADYNTNAPGLGLLPIRLQFTGTYTDGINKLRLAVMAKSPPHLAQIYEIGTQQLVDSGSVIPLEDLIAGDVGFGLEQMLPQVLSYYRIKGKLFSLPFATSNPVIFANGEALEAAGMKAPPTTFEALEADCPKLASPEKGRTCLTLPLTSWLFEQSIARQGAVLLDSENGRQGVAANAVYASLEGRFFLDFLVRLSSAGMFANTGRSWDPPVENFMSGRSALLVTSTSDVFVLAQRARFPVVVGPFPVRADSSSVVGAVTGGGTVLGGNSIWAMKGRPDAEMKQAYQFLKYLASPDVQRRWHVNTGYFPIRRDVIEALEREGFYKENPNARVAVDQLLAAPDSAAAKGALAGVFPEIREHVENAMEEALAGKLSSVGALERAQIKSSRALQRYRKLL